VTAPLAVSGPGIAAWPLALCGLAYALAQGLLAVYGLHRYALLGLFARARKAQEERDVALAPADTTAAWPRVTVQLPVHDERFVVERLIDSACALEYEPGLLEIQVLDDSTDDTTARAAARVAFHRARGVDVVLVHREARTGFKAGALAAGLASAKGDLIAVFDADFLPRKDFLTHTVPAFRDPRIGCVQTRWGHLNRNWSWLTEAQALFLDGHFAIEHGARAGTGRYFNFNGTAGVWRRAAIADAGGWSDATVTEDLDLSYRAQMRGWRFAYRPDVVAPAELPVDIHAFKSQQRRWTKGSIQTARRILPALWRGRAARAIKIEAFFHLTCNLAYLLLVVSLLLLGPVLALPPVLPAWLSAAFLGFMFFTGMAAVAAHFVAARRALGEPWAGALASVPGALLIGVGMSLTNALAVLSAFAPARRPGADGGWQRTPKYGVTRRGGRVTRGRYATGDWRSGIGEALLALYALALLGVALVLGRWPAVPFLGFLALGFGAVAWLSMRPVRAAGSVAAAEGTRVRAGTPALAAPPATISTI